MLNEWRNEFTRNYHLLLWLPKATGTGKVGTVEGAYLWRRWNGHKDKYFWRIIGEGDFLWAGGRRNFVISREWCWHSVDCGFISGKSCLLLQMICSISSNQQDSIIYSRVAKYGRLQGLEAARCLVEFLLLCKLQWLIVVCCLNLEIMSLTTSGNKWSPKKWNGATEKFCSCVEASKLSLDPAVTGEAKTFLQTWIYAK